MGWFNNLQLEMDELDKPKIVYKQPSLFQNQNMETKERVQANLLALCERFQELVKTSGNADKLRHAPGFPCFVHQLTIPPC